MDYLKQYWQPISYGFLVASVIGFLLWALYPQTTPQFVTLDSKHLTQHFAKQLSQSNLPKAQKNTLTERFAACLIAVSNDYARDNNVVILTKSSVVTGLPDVSFAIAADIKAQMEIH